MNYHEKFGASSLKIDWVMLNSVFGGHFVFGGHILFWRPFCFLAKKMWRVIMNYYAKSGASSLKIDWVILSLIFGGHFVFLQKCEDSLWTTIQNLELLAWKLTELCSILFFGGHFVLWRPFFHQDDGELCPWVPRENPMSLSSPKVELWLIALPSPALAAGCEWVSQWVTTLGIELLPQLKIEWNKRK